MAFQWNPSSCEWGNMSWGHALSRDLVNWKVSSQPSIRPSLEDDPDGVFTGCVSPTNPHGVVDGTITSLYTSAQHSPIHWTLPYKKGSELVRMATSVDNGKSWKRLAHPLLSGPPDGLDVTAWRDPFIGTWESIDECLGRGKKERGRYKYGLVSGGIRHCSPTIFLYEIDALDLSSWTYLCTPLLPGLNFAPSKTLPDFGTSWEVVNFMTLTDQRDVRYDVLIMSVEGILPRPRPRSHTPIDDDDDTARRDRGRGHRPSRKPRRIARAQNWLCAKVTGPNNRDDADVEIDTSSPSPPAVSLEFQFGGCLDFGCFYAANSFHDPVTGEQIALGWITEEDLPAGMAAKQGWSGLLSLPRVLCMRCITGVVGSSRSDSNLESLDWIHTERCADGTYTVTTLTSTPDPRLEILRRDEKDLIRSLGGRDICLDGEEDGDASSLHMLHFETKKIEAQASFSLIKGVEQIGLELYFDPGESFISGFFVFRHCTCVHTDAQSFLRSPDQSHNLLLSAHRANHHRAEELPRQNRHGHIHG